MRHSNSNGVWSNDCAKLTDFVREFVASIRIGAPSGCARRVARLKLDIRIQERLAVKRDPAMDRSDLLAALTTTDQQGTEQTDNKY
jgi:hypothetical protein